LQFDLIVVGGGPAGLATAIAASLRGLRVKVIDARKPPIDKACGEGILPHGVAALCSLGVNLDSTTAIPFSGLKFSDEKSAVSGTFVFGTAFGIRRTALHRLLVERATDLGVSFAWESRALRFDSRAVHTSSDSFSYKWLIGADGERSSVARFAGLAPHGRIRPRFGFRRHYEIEPWNDHVEFHWGHRCQMAVTPTGRREVCLSFFTSDPAVRLSRAFTLFPEVALRVGGAHPLSSEAGAVTMLRRARGVTRGNVALVGDASCTVDGIAGMGLSLALQQAIHLADALAHENLSDYSSAHRCLVRTPMRITRLLLAMNSSSALRRKVLRLFAAKPALFAKIISIHGSESAFSAFGASELLNLGWRALWA
jgi:menaquinone-9 beta-reductase